MMNKKASVSTIQMVAMTVLILLVLVVSSNLYGNSVNTFISAVNPIGDDAVVKACQASAKEKIDVDGDGLYDECDFCVLKFAETSDKAKIRNAYDNAEIIIEQISSVNPGYSSGQDIEELNKKHDPDGDGIVGICDSQPDKKIRFSSNKVKAECKKLYDALQGDGFDIDYEADAHNGAYSRCVIEYVG
jgi:hypothetical protein